MPEWLGATTSPVDPLTGDVAAGSEPAVFLSADADNAIIVGSDGGLWYGDSAVMRTDPARLRLHARPGEKKQATIQVRARGETPPVSVVSDSDWLTVATNGDRAPFTITASIDASRLASRKYAARITITAPHSVGAVVPVELHVGPGDPGRPIQLRPPVMGLETGPNFVEIGGRAEPVDVPLFQHEGTVAPMGDGAFRAVLPAGTYQPGESVGVAVLWGDADHPHPDPWREGSPAHFYTDTVATASAAAVRALDSDTSIGVGACFTFWAPSGDVSKFDPGNGFISHAYYRADKSEGFTAVDAHRLTLGSPGSTARGRFCTVLAVTSLLEPFTIPSPITVTVARAGQARTAGTWDEVPPDPADIEGGLLAEAFHSIYLGQCSPDGEALDLLAEAVGEQSIVTEALLKCYYPALGWFEGGAS